MMNKIHVGDPAAGRSRNNNSALAVRTSSIKPYKINRDNPLKATKEKYLKEKELQLRTLEPIARLKEKLLNKEEVKGPEVPAHLSRKSKYSSPVLDRDKLHLFEYYKKDN